MTRVGTAAISVICGLFTAVILPVLIILLGKFSVLASITSIALYTYMALAEVSGFIVNLLPWSEWFPAGGASGAFAMVFCQILFSWGMLFSILWYLFFRIRSRKVR